MAGAGAERRQLLCSADAIYYGATNINQGVNTNNSYYLRLCLLKVMSLNGWDGAVESGGLNAAPVIYENGAVDEFNGFVLFSSNDVEDCAGRKQLANYEP